MTPIIMVDGTAIPLGGPRGPAGPDGNPIGTVISFMGSAAPEDYLVCDGGVHNIAEYPDLAEFFRKQFGAANHFGGDGETNFAVPDLRNLFLRGYHGEADEQLSGEIGEKQAGTIFPYIFLDEESYIQVQAAESKIKSPDSVSGDAPAYKIGYTNKKGISAPTHFTSRPVNTAILYCIKARTSASAEDVYSLEERIVGRWIDGRPLYKKTIVGTSTAAGSVTAIEDVSELSIDWVVNSYGHIQSGLSVGLVPLPCTMDSGTLCIIGLSANRTKINMLTASSDFAKKPFSYTLEYVKTTDQATIPLPETAANVLQEDWPGAAEDETVREEV